MRYGVKSLHKVLNLLRNWKLKFTLALANGSLDNDCTVCIGVADLDGVDKRGSGAVVSSVDLVVSASPCLGMRQWPTFPIHSSPTVPVMPFSGFPLQVHNGGHETGANTILFMGFWDCTFGDDVVHIIVSASSSNFLILTHVA